MLVEKKIQVDFLVGSKKNSSGLLGWLEKKIQVDFLVGSKKKFKWTSWLARKKNSRLVEKKFK
jgi:hypothetical protein